MELKYKKGDTVTLVSPRLGIEGTEVCIRNAIAPAHALCYQVTLPNENVVWIMAHEVGDVVHTVEDKLPDGLIPDTVSEFFKALLDGKKLRNTGWGKGMNSRVWFDEATGTVRFSGLGPDSEGIIASASLMNSQGPWEIYVPRKNMTKADIEEALGYNINIIEEN